MVEAEQARQLVRGDVVLVRVDEVELGLRLPPAAAEVRDHLAIVDGLEDGVVRRCVPSVSVSRLGAVTPLLVLRVLIDLRVLEERPDLLDRQLRRRRRSGGLCVGERLGRSSENQKRNDE